MSDENIPNPGAGEPEKSHTPPTTPASPPVEPETGDMSMDGLDEPGLPKLREAIDKARAEFQARLDEVKRVAADWGARPEHPEGVFISAMLATQAGFADMALAAANDLRSTMGGIIERQREAVGGVVADARAMTEAEVARLHGARRLAETELERAGTALRTLEIKKKTLTTEMVQVIAPGLREELKQAIVIRERRWNRNVEWGRYAAVAAVALGVFLGGYGWRTWQDAKTMAAVEQCDLHPISDAKGTHYCFLEPLLSP